MLAALMAYIYWNVRPEILHLGGFTVRWYGVLFALAFLLAFFVVRWHFRVEHKSERHLDSMLVYLVVGTIMGARLGHCLFYDPQYYLAHPLEILAVWKGGLASHGGAAGILVALWLYSRRHPDQPYLWLLDRITVPAALAGALIRVGNFFNSEILGTPSTLPWAVIFAREDPAPRHPAQLYEAIVYLLIFAGLVALYRRLQSRTPHGLILGIFLAATFTARFFIEFVKQRQASYEQQLLLSVGQWLSIPFVLAGIALVWIALHKGAPPAVAGPQVREPGAR